MTAPADDPVAPLRKAKVAIVLNASDRDHFAVSGATRFEAACPPWATATFLADHDIGEELGEMLEQGDVDAVVFASNSLTTAAARRAVQDGFERLWAEDDDAPARDVGVLVLHQFLERETVLGVDFLGSAAFSLVGQTPRKVDERDIHFRPDWLFTDETGDAERATLFRTLATGYGTERFCVWARFEPRHPVQWEPVVWDADGNPLIAACYTGRRQVIASRLPIDLMGNTELLRSLIASCLRQRGCLLVETPETRGSTAFTPALASAIEAGRFVHRDVRPARPGDIDPARAPYHFFNELIVAREWRVDQMDALEEPTILRKLEQGGSIVATFDGPRRIPITVRLAGRPQYVQRASQFEAWLLPRLEGFKGDPWATHGLAQAVVATRNAFVDDTLIPQALRAAFVRRHVADKLVARVREDNVDDNVLVTLVTYATLRALEVTGHDALRTWAEARLDSELPSVVAQAILLVPELATDERRQRVREAAARFPERDDGRLLSAYAAVIFADSEPQRVSAAAQDQSLGLGVQAELLRAVARNPIQATDAIIGLAATVRQRVDRLAAGEGALEAVSVGSAALIELARRQGVGPTAAPAARPRGLDARTIENTELVRGREEAERRADGYRAVGRKATTALVWLLILVTVAAVAAILVLFHKGIDARIGFALTVFAPLSALTGYVIKKARDADLPPWLPL